MNLKCLEQNPARGKCQINANARYFYFPAARPPKGLNTATVLGRRGWGRPLRLGSPRPPQAPWGGGREAWRGRRKRVFQNTPACRLAHKETAPHPHVNTHSPPTIRTRTRRGAEPPPPRPTHAETAPRPRPRRLSPLCHADDIPSLAPHPGGPAPVPITQRAEAAVPSCDVSLKLLV